MMPTSNLIKKFSLKEPKLYVSTILDVHKKYNALVLTAFANDSGFVASLDKACGKFINNNSVTKKANASTKSPGKMHIDKRVLIYSLVDVI